MRLEIREQTPAWLPWAAIFLAGFVTMSFAALLLVFAGASPIDGFRELFMEPLALEMLSPKQEQQQHR